MRGLLLCAIVFGSIPALPESAVGASPDAEAKKLSREGVRQFKKGRWQRALESFEASQRLAPSAETSLQIGATYREMGRPLEAIEAFEGALKQRGPGDADARARAEQEIGQLDTKVGRLAVEAPAGTRVRIRDRELGATPLEPVRLMPGTHAVMLVVPGREPVGVAAMVVAGQTETVRPPSDETAAPAAVVAQAPAAPAAPEPPPPPAAPTAPAPAAEPQRAEVDVSAEQSSPWITQRHLARGTFVVGGAMFVTGVLLAALAHSADSDVEDCLEAPRWTASCDDAVDRRGNYAPPAYWLTGAGAAAAIGGAVWLYLLGDETDSAAATAGARLSVIPGGALVTLDLVP